MKYQQLFLCGLWGLFLLSETVGANFHGEHTLLSDNQRNKASSKFKCPHMFGTYPDSEDCSHYYICYAGVAVHKKCRMFTRFDVWRRTCLPIGIAVCENDKDKTKPTTYVTTSSPGVTSTEDNFVCSSFTGNFPHPNDCSKYYSCTFYIARIKTCPKKELFDIERKKCQPEKKVDCGDRPRPGSTTTTSLPTETVTEITPTVTEVITETISTTTEIITETISTTTEMITESTIQTDKEPLDTTTDATTGDITTTIQPTPPPHDCNEDDDDCIIEETGDPKDWFKCPRDVGAFPHPSSDKLFIFCKNWIPSAKKCGLGRVFSKEMSTCVDVKYIL